MASFDQDLVERFTLEHIVRQEAIKPFHPIGAEPLDEGGGVVDALIDPPILFGLSLMLGQDRHVTLSHSQGADPEPFRFVRGPVRDAALTFIMSLAGRPPAQRPTGALSLAIRRRSISAQTSANARAAGCRGAKAASGARSVDIRSTALA